MTIVIYDPRTSQHQYLTEMYFAPMIQYASRNQIVIKDASSLSEIKNSTVLALADHLNPFHIDTLKNNGNKIVGFSVTDSSWVSQCCREGVHLQKIDLMFMLTGIQKVNHGMEMIVKPDFTIGVEPRQFLPDEDWGVFNAMREAGRLQSLPYVHWERQPSVEGRPYSTRNQQALIRGGHHMRRFILALKLLEIDKLDCNSGFVTEPYFQDSMNPQFRYCDSCRAEWKHRRKYPSGNPTSHSCTNPMARPLDLSDLGAWNNRCPQSFYDVANILGVPPAKAESLLNARWLTQQQHLEMLARITFTADLKWLFSIYAAQRFWDAASVGCINLLPSRTADQDYFPKMEAGVHYELFDEHLNSLQGDCIITGAGYDGIAPNAKALYDEWMRPTDYSINTNLLIHIFAKIEEHTA